MSIYEQQDFEIGFENLQTDCNPLADDGEATVSTEPNNMPMQAGERSTSRVMDPSIFEKCTASEAAGDGQDASVKRDRDTTLLTQGLSNTKRARNELHTDQCIEPEGGDDAGEHTPVYTPSPATPLEAPEDVIDPVHEAQLGELLELERDGFGVVWPAGWTSVSAKAKMRERPSVAEPASKVRAVQLPERTTICDSTLANVQRRNVAPPLAVPKRMGPAPSAAPTFGSGHDLRRSGDLIWCRKCGRYGAERFRDDGLGGPCHGPRARNMTQWKRLMSGRHPTDKHRFLPPDVAFYR